MSNKWRRTPGSGRRMPVILSFLAGLTLAVSLSAGAEAGLLTKLPPDGTWSRYEGTWEVVEVRLSGETVRSSFTKRVTISSVGREMVDSEPARWIELKVETARTASGAARRGETHSQWHKVLVLEREIGAGDRPFLPIVRGYRRTSEQEAREMRGGLLRISPAITLLDDKYPQSQEAGTEEVSTDVGTFQCRRVDGKRVREIGATRFTNEGQAWYSDEVPYGIVRWRATIAREEAKETDGKKEYRPAGSSTAELTLVQTGTGAVSDLPNSN